MLSVCKLLTACCYCCYCCCISPPSQVAAPVDGVVPSWRSLFRELLAEEGLSGLMRGVAPRMASSAMWGTAMVSVYEFLKRLCAQP